MKEEWKKVRLGEICEYVTSGGTPLASKEDFYEPGIIPWLKTKEVNYCRIYETENHISQKGLDNSSAKLIPENSVIMAMYGQGDTAGRVAINKIPLTTNQACCNLIIDKNKADYNFVYYKLSTMYEKIIALKSGGAQPNLNAGKVKGLEISLPPLATQQKIASILSAYDDLIENNRRQIKLLEEAAQKLYKEWFVKLNFPGHEKAKIADGVPDGWKIEKIDNVYNIKYGKNLPTSEIKTVGKFPVYGAHGIIGYYDKYNCSQKVTLITSRGNGSGDVLCTKQPETFVTNNSFVVLPRENFSYFDFSFIYGQMNELDFRAIRTGSAQPQLTNNSISMLNVVIPKRTVIEEYTNVAKNIYDKIDVLDSQIQYLQSARDKLLPKLMNGEIEV